MEVGDGSDGCSQSLLRKPPIAAVPQSYEVFFDFDKSVLTPEGKRILATGSAGILSAAVISDQGHGAYRHRRRGCLQPEAVRTSRCCGRLSSLKRLGVPRYPTSRKRASARTICWCRLRMVCVKRKTAAPKSC